MPQDIIITGYNDIEFNKLPEFERKLIHFHVTLPYKTQLKEFLRSDGTPNVSVEGSPLLVNIEGTPFWAGFFIIEYL